MVTVNQRYSILKSLCSSFIAVVTVNQRYSILRVVCMLGIGPLLYDGQQDVRRTRAGFLASKSVNTITVPFLMLKSWTGMVSGSKIL